jgi:epoxyqueuosine reductase QueG
MAMRPYEDDLVREILIDAELEHVTLTLDYCGKCTARFDVCPTQANGQNAPD